MTTKEKELAISLLVDYEIEKITDDAVSGITDVLAEYLTQGFIGFATLTSAQLTVELDNYSLTDAYLREQADIL